MKTTMLLIHVCLFYDPAIPARFRTGSGVSGSGSGQEADAHTQEHATATPPLAGTPSICPILLIVFLLSLLMLLLNMNITVNTYSMVSFII